MRPISEIIIHCTATMPNWRAGSKTSAKVSEVRRWHKDRGWSDIGYHYLIDRDGTIAKGRPIERVGAHVRGHNKGTIGVALFGGHGSSENDHFADNYTPEQDAALRRLLAELQTDYGPGLKISAHHDYAAKACPGFRVDRWLARKPDRKLSQSTTLQAAGLSSMGVVGAAGTALGALDDAAQLVVIGAACVALLGLAWIARERIRKWAAGVR